MDRPPRYLLWAAFGFIFWGGFPVYFKLLDSVSALEIISHRITWSWVLVGGYLFASNSLKKLHTVLIDTRSLGLLGLAAFFISANWISYVYSVLNGYVLEVSLAYFISPLFTIMLGIFFLGEKVSHYKTLAIFLCATALIFKMSYGQSISPYALVIAGGFSCYGMVKKKIPHHSLAAFFIEISYLLLPALGYLFYLDQGDSLAFSLNLKPLTFLLIGLGLVSTTPLVIFSRSVKNIDLSIMGFLQYITPFVTFVLAIWIYEEAMTWVNIVVFGLIWMAVILISLESLKKKFWNKP